MKSDAKKYFTLFGSQRIDLPKIFIIKNVSSIRTKRCNTVIK